MARRPRQNDTAEIANPIALFEGTGLDTCSAIKQKPANVLDLKIAIEQIGGVDVAAIYLVQLYRQLSEISPELHPADFIAELGAYLGANGEKLLQRPTPKVEKSCRDIWSEAGRKFMDFVREGSLDQYARKTIFEAIRDLAGSDELLGRTAYEQICGRDLSLAYLRQARQHGVENPAIYGEPILACEAASRPITLVDA